MPEVPNLDAMGREDLEAFATRHGCGFEWYHLFPPDVGTEPERFDAADDLAAYAVMKRRAIYLREAGEIREALRVEARCDDIYKRLPEWARW